MAKLSAREWSTGEGLVGERRRETRSVSRSSVLGSSMATGRERRARVQWEGKERSFGLVERTVSGHCFWNFQFRPFFFIF